MQNSSRRTFIKSAAALAGTAFAPNLLLGQEKALKQLNVASIGCGGKGASDISEISGGNRIAFLCDVDKKMAAKAMEREQRRRAGRRQHSHWWTTAVAH